MSFLDLLFPRRCLGCSSLGTYLCPSCTNRLSPIVTPICPICTRPSLYGYTHPRCRTSSLDGLTSTLLYQGLTKKIIEKFKYQLVTDLKIILSDIIASFTDFTPLQPHSWCLVPVPLHPRRLRYRSFNQSLLLARLLSAYTHWPLNDQLLLRTRHTTPQMTLNRTARLSNLKNAFAIHHPPPIVSRSFLLIDDVWTTGTTLRECASVLKRNGAQTVWAYTLARAIQ